MLESTIVANIVVALKAQGFWVFKVHGGPDQTKGIPDLLGCAQGYFFGLEVKVDPKEEPTKMQSYQINEIAKAGGIVGVVTSVQEALDVFRCSPVQLRGEGYQISDRTTSDR